jgi:hypothetical protein
MGQKRRSTRRRTGSQVAMCEGPGKRYHVNRLKWLVDFLNTDIFKLPPGGFLKVFHEFLVFFYSGYADSEVLREVCRDTDRDRKELSEAQSFLDRALSDIRIKLRAMKRFGASPELREGPEWELFREDVETTRAWPKDLIPLAFHVIGERLMLIPEIKIHKYEDLRDDVEIGEFREYESVYTIYGRDVLGESDRLRLGRFSEFCDPAMESSLRFGLYLLLEEFPLSTIEQCPDCSRYIVMTTKKKLPFCNSCLKKQSVYRWRKRNRSLYNAYQRNRQKGVPTSIKELRGKRGKGHEHDGE